MKKLFSNNYQKLSWLIALAAAVAIYWHLDIDKIKDSFSQYFHRGWDGQNILLLILAVILVFVNVLMDAWKWKILLSKLRKTSIGQSLSMSFRGIATSLIAPNRTGDFIGRIQYLDKPIRWKAFILSGISSLLQLLATILFGAFSLLWLQNKFDIFHGPLTSYWWISLLVIALTFVFRKSLIRRIKQSKFYPILRERLQVLKEIKGNTLLGLFGISLLRYLIFISQLYLIYQGLGMDIPWNSVLVAQSAVYISLAFIPHSLLLDAAFRGPLAIYFFGLLGYGSAEVLIGAYILFVLNILFPAFIGMFFFKNNFSFFKKKSNEVFSTTAIDNL